MDPQGCRAARALLANHMREGMRREPDTQPEQHERYHTRWRKREGANQLAIAMQSIERASKAWPEAVAVWCDVIQETRRN